MRRWWYIPVGAVSLLGATLVGALVFLASSSGERWLQQQVRAQLAQAGLDVSVDRISVGVFPPRLVVHRLVVGALDDHARCTVATAEVIPSFFDLVVGTLRLEEVYLSRPTCSVRLGVEEMARLRGAEGGGDQDALPALLRRWSDFGAVGFSNARVSLVVDDPEGLGTGRVTVAGWYLDATGGAVGKAHVEVRTLWNKAAVFWERGDVQIRETVHALSARLGVYDDVVRVRYADAAADAVAASVRRLEVPLVGDVRRVRVARLDLRGDLRVLERLPWEVPAVRGTASVSGSAQLVLDGSAVTDGSFQGHVAVRDCTVDEVVVGDADAEVFVGSEGIAVADGTLRQAGGSAAVEGSVAFTEGLPVQGKVVLRGIGLADLLENVGVPGSVVQQTMSGPIAIQGRLLPLDLRVRTRLRIADLRVYDASFRASRRTAMLHIPAVAVSGPLRITEEGVRSDRLRVERGKTALDVGLRFAFSAKGGWKIDVASRRADLADVGSVAGVALGGTGSLACSITSPRWEVVRLAGRVDLRDAVVGPARLRQVAAKVRFDGRRLYFGDVAAQTRNSRATAPQVVLDFGARDGLRIAGEAVLEKADLDDVARALRFDTRPWGKPDGVVSGRVAFDVGGPPDRWRVDVQLEHRGLVLFNEVFGAGGVQALWDRGALHLTRFDLKKGAGSLSVQGTVSPDRSIHLAMTATGVRVEDIVYPGISDLGIRGKVQFLATVDGTLDHPVGTGELRLSNGRIEDVYLGTSQLQLSLDGSLVTAKGNAADSAIQLEYGSWNVQTGRFVVESFVSDVDVGKLWPALQDWGVRSRVTGELVFSGVAGDDWSVDGTARLYDVRVNRRGFALANRDPVVLTVSRNRLTLAPVEFVGKHAALRLSGTLYPDRLDVGVDGVVALQVLPQWTDAVERAAGSLRFHAQVAGPYDAPGIRASAQVANGSVRAAGFPHPVRAITARLKVANGKVRLEECTGKVAGGVVDATGWAELDGTSVSDYRFGVQATGIDLDLVEGLSLRLSTTGRGLSIRPHEKRPMPLITGDVEVSKFRYTEPIQIIDISDLSVRALDGRSRRTHHPRVYDKSKDVFAYDVRLHGDKGLSVVNNVLDARFRIDDTREPLRLVGTNQWFGFLGRVLTAGGNVYFAGKSFEIRSGVISFKDPYRPDNPYFRVTADVDVRDWKITIVAEGTVDEYEVRLSSQPYLSREDIVLLLLSGLTKQEHAQMRSQGMSMTLAPLLENVSSGIIPVEVKVYSEYSEKAGADVTRMALGKRIMKDVWVQVSSGVGQTQDVEGVLVYDINDNFSVSASYDNKDETSTAGNWGLDLRFRLEF